MIHHDTVTICPPEILTCPSPMLPMPQGLKIDWHPGGGAGCDGFRDTGNARQEACCGEPVYEIVSCGPTPHGCPEGFVPETPNIVRLAKHSPLFSALFGCYDEHELFRYLCCMEQYRLPGCENGDLAVLFAAAHFFVMQTLIHRSMNATMVAQATKAKSLNPLTLPTVERRRAGDEQWFLTSYGIQYTEQFKRPVVALLGMAWGI